MFERYTEAARRTVYHARHTATEFGRTEIETEHLLVGLLHDSAFANRFLPRVPVNDVREEIKRRTLFQKRLASSIDMPLSNESKRVLAYAAEEAERLAHQQIGNEHLLLGILRESRCLAAQLLIERGVNAQDVRIRLAAEVSTKPHGAVDAPLSDIVEIHGEMWDAAYVREQADALRRFYWQLAEWRPLDVAEQGGKISFDLTLADREAFRRVPRGWATEACAICRWELIASVEEAHSTGYTNGRDWVCVECYQTFLAAE